MRRSRLRGVQLSLALLLLGTLPAAPVQAQNDEARAFGGDQWFIGGYYRQTWIPGFVLAPFFERAPVISNPGGGVTISHRSRSGVSAELGFGYVPYRFSGAFTADGNLVEDTEYVRSKLAFLHLTGSLLWPIELHRMLDLEIGLGVDLGALVGAVRRTEAYPDSNGKFRACDRALQPATTGPDNDETGAAIPYCNQALDSHGNPIASNAASTFGAHYNATERHIPPIMLIPMLPHIALRFAPHERVAFKLEAAFGLAQFWLGFSVHVGLGLSRPAATNTVDALPVPMAAPIATGRVLGKLMEKSTDRPIAQASVKSERSFSAIETDARGLFVFDKLEPGPVHFEITQPDYEAGSCDTSIPSGGGDVFLHCFLASRPRQGAISGQVKDEQSKPVAGARVEITGPANTLVVTEAEGLFALPDAPEGAYRVRVEAAGFFIQLIEIEVRSQETSLPQVILIKKSGNELVTRKANQIAIKQEIAFETNSAEISSSSHELLHEIADLLLRSPDIELVEIQGHTDDHGDRARNQQLSEERAAAVRAWLITGGVDAARLQARGYGQERPLRPNDTAADRAKNRRVQFVVMKQATAASGP